MCCDRVTFLSKFSITMNTSCCVVILLMFTNIVIVLGGAEPSECENKPSEKHCIVEYSSRYRVRHTPRYIYDWATRRCIMLRWASYCPLPAGNKNNFFSESECYFQCGGWA
ncbi:uncharacterized protein LOC105382575 [Plutella xylostella]|uniref:uncharacterized protein LOC105382575 n=1 Tax=Plutella xylostella TaxID=51655 RepID=UPI00203256C4|nr:uncharacterized protein LOC105382575 [Plutella xylostella]